MEARLGRSDTLRLQEHDGQVQQWRSFTDSLDGVAVLHADEQGHSKRRDLTFQTIMRAACAPLHVGRLVLQKVAFANNLHESTIGRVRSGLT